MTALTKTVATAIAASCLLISCAHRQTVRIKATRPLTPEEARIVEIARQAVAKNDASGGDLEFEVPQRTGEGQWDVLVWQLPATPGGFRVITVDENGRVIRYHHGY